jgi:translocator protein
MNTYRPDVPLAAGRAFTAAGAAVATLVLALVVGAMAPPDSGFAELRKPTWQPALYGLQISWAIAHTLLAGCLALLLREPASPPRRRALWLLAAQFGLLLLWPALLFGADRLSLAFLAACALWLVTLAVVAAAAGVRPLAGGMQIPVLGWVSFMLVLNGVVVALNPQA